MSAKLPAVKDGEGLTGKQAVLTDALESGLSINAAAKKAKYSGHSSAAYNAVSKTVERELRRRRSTVLATEGAQAAMRSMIELAKSGPATVRFQAAKFILEVSGHRADDPARLDDPELHEMTPDQLRRFIDNAQATIAEGGDPPVIRVKDQP